AQVQPTDYLTEREFYRVTRILEERDADRHQELLAKIEQIGALLTPPDHEEALKIYLQTVARQTARLPLSPLDPSGRESTQIALHQVFISLNAGTTGILAIQKVGKDKGWERRAAVGH